MKAVVTGGGGFIGGNLVQKLEQQGDSVIVVDNFSRGHKTNLRGLKCEVRELDLVETGPRDLATVFDGADAVFHLAANADVRFGWDHPARDLEQNVVATCNALEGSRIAGVKDFIFTSTGSIYGEDVQLPALEDTVGIHQTSLYSASKLAAEAFCEAYAEFGMMRITVFRLVSALGPLYSHGHVVDFVNQLRQHPNRLKILGNGEQAKSYIHVDDVCAALVGIRADEGFRCFNLGTGQTLTPWESAQFIAEYLGVSPEIEVEAEPRGWVGDNPNIILSTDRAERAGWEAKKTIRDGLSDTLEWLVSGKQNRG